jgi:hypothetical protein
MARDGEVSDLRREVQILIGHVEGKDAIRREVFFVERNRFYGEQV